MALGFGPSIEHELQIQPLVADLLISFAYAAIKRQNLPADLMPSGLAFRVPDPKSFEGEVISLPPQQSRSPLKQAVNAIGRTTDFVGAVQKRQSYVAKFSLAKQELIFEQKPSPVRVGDWVAIKVEGRPTLHCKVLETRHFPTVHLSEPVVAESVKEEPAVKSKSESTLASDPSNPLKQCVVYLYDCNFDDDLTMVEKYNTMALLLDLMPSVTEMGDYIKANPGKSLSTWSRMPPASLLILRWTIASTRASIMQVDVPVLEKDEADVGQVAEKPSTREPRVQGMKDWIVSRCATANVKVSLLILSQQFRFASGAPDKEQRYDRDRTLMVQIDG